MSSTLSSSRKRNAEQGDDKDSKKPRLVWIKELHEQFLTAVKKLNGVENAIPTKILAEMNVPGLTLGQVSSHLQKYRLQLQNRTGRNQNNTTGQEGSFGPLSTLSRSELTAQSRAQAQLLSTGLRRRPVMVSNTRSGHGNGHNWQQPQLQPQMSLHHGVPTELQQQLPMSVQHSKQLVSPHQGNQNNSFMTTRQDASFGPLSTLNRSELQTLAAEDQSLAHRLTAGLSRPAMVSNTRFGDGIFGQHHWQKPQPQPQVSLHHGVPRGGIQQKIPMSTQQQIAAADVLRDQQPSLRGPLPMLPLSQSSIRQPMLPTGYTNRATTTSFTTANYDDMFNNGLDGLNQDSEADSSSSMSRNNTTVVATEHDRDHQQPPPGMVLHHQVYAADEGGRSAPSDEEELMMLLTWIRHLEFAFNLEGLFNNIF